MNTPARRGADPRIFQAIEALKSHQPVEAIRLLETIIQQNKSDPQLLFLLGSAYSQQGNTGEVIRHNEMVLQMLPHHVGALCNLGGAYASNGQQQRATDCFQKALRLAPQDPFVHLSLAETMLLAGNTEGAIPHFQAALRLQPDLVQAHKRLGHIHWSVGHLELAEKHYEQACRINPADADSLNEYILTVGHSGRLEEALKLLDNALAKTPNDPNLLANKAHLLERDGQHEQAFKLLRDIEKKGLATPISAATLAVLCHRFNYCDETLVSSVKLLDNHALDGPSRKLLCFGLGSMLDKLGRYDEAFSYFQQANEAVPLRFDSVAHERNVTTTIDTFSPARLPVLPRAGNHDQRPIFIVGMPRSGTSLTEQILASHPDVYAAGELGHITDLANGLRGADGGKYPAALVNLSQQELERLAAQYLRKLDELAPDAPRITDKMPQNFLYLGLITLLFPKAIIIHCRRNPLDTCLSIYFQNFSWGYDWGTDLENIARYYLQYERLMNHWQEVIGSAIFHLQYEVLVADQEESTRQLLAHCGLEWNDACRDFHKTKRWVTTASFDQVREKMYTSSVERWRNYRPHIEPLVRVLAPLMPSIADA